MSEQHSLFHLSFLFYMVLDPIGNLPIFSSLLKHFDTKKQIRIIIRELLIALVIMIACLYFGQAFFKLLQISTPSLELAGGTILFMIALKMIFSSPQPENRGRPPKDPLIVPLAVPATAGPGILATITLYGGGIEGGADKMTVLLAIFISWGLTVPTLIFSPFLKKMFGNNGIIAAERLFGFIIVWIACEMGIHGLLTIFQK